MSTSSQKASLGLLSEASGVGPSTLEDFEKAGFDTANEVGVLSPEELADKVSGVGYSTAVSVLKHLEREGYRQEKNRDEDLERLVELLQDLFEFENKDRDFGVYKLMNANRDEIDNYIKNELIDTIETEVSELYDEFSGKTEEKARDEVIDELGSDAFDGNELSDKAKQEIKERSEGPTEDELENIRSDIYNHIYQFFTRYYDSGDFITRRKRSHHEDQYSVPYDGSNTNFHWVTKDQYYAKTSEQFMRFTFTHNNTKFAFKTVHDELDEASGIGNSEYFVMANPEEITIEDGVVIVPFYRRMISDSDLARFDISANTHNKQSSMNNTFAEELYEYITGESVSIEEEKLQNKIDEYTTRNQNDFFIHKDIQGFLENEVEEYIKTEVVQFEPSSGLESMSDLSVEKGRIVNKIVTDIIEFVSQLEEFKRKLFEKKKFVTDRKQLVQVSELNEDYYSTVLSNDEQLSEWEDTYDIDTSELTSEDLVETPYSQMVVDTQYFEEDITTGEEPKNKLIKGDNYQALNFLQEKYNNSVKCIYIDPPYNTGNANFAYKDKYQRPTWLSMMYDRLELAREILSKDGAIFVSIDENELENTSKILNEIFGEKNQLGVFIWKNRTSANETKTNISVDHEYIICYAKDIENIKFKGVEKEFNGYKNPDDDPRGEWRSMDMQMEYRGNDSMVYPIKDPDTDRQFTPREGRRWTYGRETMTELIEDNKIWFPDDNDGVPRRKRLKSEVDPYKTLSTILSTEKVGRTSTGTNELKKIFGKRAYDYPKPSVLIKLFLEQITEDRDIVLDFFAGSGTTGQAVQELNREREEQINYVLVEMLNEAFEITEKRAKRIAFSNNWKDGEPQLDESVNELQFSAECIELESYEESLDAVEFENVMQDSLNSFNPQILQYLLEFGTKEAPVFLETGQLTKPLEYKLDSEIKEQPIDILTTFNYLIGLDSITEQSRTISSVKYTIYDGKIGNESVRIVWRHNAEEVDYETEVEQIETDDFDRVYVNGDSMLEGSQLISNTFSKNMLTTGDAL